MKLFAALLLIALQSSLAQLPEAMQKQFDEAERRIVRLPPLAFPDLPANIARELLRRGCTIPQEAFTKKPHNIIRGAFARPGQTDWAALCSINGASSILVFWNGSEQNPASIASMEDRNYLQSISATEIGFSRGIMPANQDFIVRHFRAYGGPTPPPMDHLGIDDAFVEKASVTWYFYQGKWLKLTGAD